MHRLIPLPLLALAAAACAEPTGQNAAPPGTSATPTASSAPSQAAEPPPPAPDDLDIAALKKTLQCAADAKSGACAIVNAFSSCRPFQAVVPSGDGRWIGKGYIVEGPKTTESFTIVRSRRVPTAEVGPGQLPTRIGITDIPKDEGPAFEQAEKLIRILSHHDVPPKSNAALEHVKKRETWPESFAMKTVSGQVYVASQGGAFICQGQKQQLFLVQRADTRKSSGDGLYAELWAISW
jgi:hypothetical protein